MSWIKRMLASRTGRWVLPLPTILLVIGCPVYDPYTESRISNNTLDAIEVELTLDTMQWRYGFEHEEFTQWLEARSDDWVHDQLMVYASTGLGVELIAERTAQFAGRYLIAPSGFMMIDSALGTQTTIRFVELTIVRGGESFTFSDKQHMLDLFVPRGSGKGSYELSITDEYPPKDTGGMSGTRLQ